MGQMRLETLDEQLQRTIGGAGEQEESLAAYETEAVFTITVSTGQIVTDKREIAESMAIFRGQQQITVRGNCCSVQEEAYVKRIGPA